MLKSRAADIVGTAVPTTSITLIWEPQLCEQLGRSRWTIHRWIAKGLLPPPIRMHDQGLTWRVRDIEHALDKLARSRKKPKPRGKLMQGDQLVSRT
jgi:predicted DNA-binding transcriptional regulator AlpA